MDKTWRNDPLVLDPEMVRVRETLELVAQTALAILILGETGSGKEVAADWLFLAVARAAPEGRPCLKINCAGLTESFVEGALFGHEKGTSPGTESEREGLFEAANGGTLFLDEIAELTPRTQAKLLRVLECGEILREGGTAPRRVDVRLVAATHCDLERLVEQGQFREDLFFRLNGVTVRVPPLRERPSEILPLVRLFIERAAAKLGKIPLPVGKAATEALLRYRWPGNVRELKHVVERAIVMCRSSELSPEHFALPQSRPALESASPPAEDIENEDTQNGIRRQMRVFERERIIAVLQQTNGNQTIAARLLGVSRRTLTNKLNIHQIDRPRKGRTALAG